MTNQLSRRLLCGALGLLLALAACNNSADPTGAEPGAARGRYVEEQLTLPENLADIFDLYQSEDGSIFLFGMRATEYTSFGYVGDYAAWSTRDNGSSWQEESYSWIAELNETEFGGIRCAAFASPDLLYLHMELYDESSEDGEESQVAAEEASSPEGDAVSSGDDAPQSEENGEDEDIYSDFFSDTPSEYMLYRADRTALEEYGPGLWKEYYPDAMKVVGENLVLIQYQKAAVMNLETGMESQVFDIEKSAVWGSYLDYGDDLMLVQPLSIRQYDLSTGEYTEMPYTSAEKNESLTSYSNSPDYSTALATAPGDDNALYYCNATGLYRTLPESQATERLMDGDLSSLTLPTVQIQYLFAYGDGFLVFCRQDDRPGLFRYTFDESVSTVPQTEIKVYSLEENATVRQAMGQFQQKNPDLKINYQVGREPFSTVTYDDALRTLSTELLAGNGPDVLILDSLPMESYVGKGVLEDLSPLLGDKIVSGELLPNIAQTFLQDETLPAIPARVGVPMILGVDIGSVRDLDSMAAYLESRPGKISTQGDFIVQRFYPICASGWFGADGSLNEQALAQDLANLKAIADEPLREEGVVYDEVNSLSFGATRLKGGGASLEYGVLLSLDDLSGPYSLFGETGEGELLLFPAIGGGAYYPLTILGVASTSSQKELAMQFVEFVLSNDILSHDFNDGLSVNAAALEKTARLGDDPHRMTVGGSYLNVETGEEEFTLLYCAMPEESITRGWIQKMAELDTPLLTDAATRQLVIRETDAYFDGNATLEEALATLKNKLALREAE